ncbi:MAG: hypothetical protein PHQ12_08810 [Chthoniobacteraceae bacterium]|nr:hypothetical protein [Chthoniobacteraceae bacterium]
MSNYQQLAAQFGKVRRSWKRAVALSGLAIVVTESIGILALLLFLDWLYQPLPGVRVGMWAAALAGIAFFAVRHVAAPLLRKIDDRQIALYIEEHRRELDGILITAAEYGPKRGGITGNQAALVDTVMEEAIARARVSAHRVVDLSRLKKYGVGAVAGTVLFGVLGILFPHAVGHHIARVVEPWTPTAEDVAKRNARPAAPGPLRFAFSKGDTSLARGTSFDLEVTLSRASGLPVELNFRPRTAGAQWQTLPMKEIEKLNGFQGTLADVSEDLEFRVASGADKSEPHRLTVFDPLVVQSLEVTTHYPAYAKLPDHVENPSNGQIAALEASTVTVRVAASNPLKEGQLKWNNGQIQNMTVDPQAPNTAVATFEVKEETGGQYAIADVNGQRTAGDAALAVHVLPDNPPTLHVKSPKAMVLTNPVGEIAFDAEADDDFGIENVDLLYSRVDAKGESHETRVPLTLEAAPTKDAPNARRGAYRLMLEDFQPPCAPEEAIAYHLEARDSKGQQAVSEIGLIAVGYFETWPTWLAASTSAVTAGGDEGPDLMAMLKAVWQLNTQKPRTPEADFQTQSKELAGQMADKKTGALRNFVDLKTYPQLAKVAPQITLHAKNAHDALLAADTAKASAELSTAAAIAAGGKLLEETALAQTKQTPPPASAGSLTSEMPQMTLLEKTRLEALKNALSDTAKTEKEQAGAGSAAEVAKGIQALITKQDEVIAKAKNQAKPESAGSLAALQKALAQKTKETAAAAANAGSADAAAIKQSAEKLGAAAKAMNEAAGHFAANNAAEAQAKAAAARKQLQEALDAVGNAGRDKLEEAIAEAESRASALLERQGDLLKKTEPLATELAGNANANQRQSRDLQDLAGRQTKIQGETEALNGVIDRLNTWAAQVGKPEAVRALGEALRTVKRSQPEKKMANAAVDLSQTNPAAATEEQKKAAEALGKICESLRNGDDAVSDSRAARISAAARKAAAAKTALAQLQPGETAGAAPKPGETAGAAPKPGETAGAAPKPGETAGAAPKPGETAGAAPKPGETAGAAPKPGETAGAAPKPGETAGAAPKPGETAGAAPKPGETAGAAPKPGEAAGKEGKAEAASKAAHNLRTLAAALDDRGIVSQQEVDKIKEISKDKDELEKSLLADPKLIKDISAIVASISGKLEKETSAMDSASKLFSFQRQECPPSYRQFVNKYFDALSEGGRTPAKP